MIIEKTNESSRWFFEKIHKIEKLLSRLTKKKKGTQINKIRHENQGDMTTDTTEIQRITGVFYMTKNRAS